MSATFNLDILLKNKKTVPLTAEFRLAIKLGLWKDYNHWYEPDVESLTTVNKLMVDHRIAVAVKMNNQDIVQTAFSGIETSILKFELPDDIPTTQCLEIKFSGLPLHESYQTSLNNLLHKYIGECVIAPMISVESFTLQGMDIKPMLEATMVGHNKSVGFNIDSPVYPWMIKNRNKILPHLFNFPMIDI